MNGFVNVLKSVGCTASDVVVRVRAMLSEKKAGHLGTLDPGASGVLPVALGSACKLFDFLTDKTKTYRAFFTFGKTTDTLDSYGKITACDGRVPEENDVCKALKRFTGAIEQIPPDYSAISVNGVRAYKLARNGVSPLLRPRKVSVYSFEMLRRESYDTYVFDIVCGAGTYIRALVRDLAAELGVFAYMSALIRLSSGAFTINEAFTLDEIEVLKDKCVKDVEYPLSNIPELRLPDEVYSKLLNGAEVTTAEFSDFVRVYCRNEFFGLGKYSKGKLKLEYRLYNGLN